MGEIYQNKQIVCSVCIANFNGENLIESCVDSVLAQTSKINIEIIIHDDASTDRSIEIIKSKYPNIKLICSETNVGFCVANNRMVLASQGQYILLLNNDAVLFEDAIDTLLKASTSNKEPAIYGLPQYDAKSKALIDVGCLLDPFFNPIPNKNYQLNKVAMVAGACFWLPRSLWDELGGFPEWFGAVGEDLYLCCRAKLAGYSVRALPASGYYHHIGASIGGGKIVKGRLSTTTNRRMLSERNKTFVMCICTPNPWFFFLIAAHIFLLLCEGIILSIYKNDYKLFMVIYAPILHEIWKYRRYLLELRRATNNTRRISIWQWLTFVKWIPHKAYMLLQYGFPTINK